MDTLWALQRLHLKQFELLLNWIWLHFVNIKNPNTCKAALKILNSRCLSAIFFNLYEDYNISYYTEFLIPFLICNGVVVLKFLGLWNPCI